MAERSHSPAPATTPVRELRAPAEDGVHLLSQVDVGYADGAEEEVLRVLLETEDLSSTSDELRSRARSWAERYHFDPARGNFLRALDVPADARVLEVGCGCGAITRWLGEHTAVVDAVEPVLLRARAAAARTRDLPEVRVFCGGLDDVPETPAYDLVVVVGVLEYVGRGSADREPYLSFLRGLTARLAPGGQVVLAIENALGVKYLAGAAEDHSGRPWEGLEGYAPDAPARTFDDRTLQGLLLEAGLDGVAHGVFPDYKLPRTLLARTALDRPDGFCARVPRFPSPDWDHPRVRTVSEQALWNSLVTAGTAATHPNSFVVVAHRTGEQPAGDLVPDGVSAVILNTERRREYMSRTTFHGEPGSGTVVRTKLVDVADPADGPSYLAGEESLHEGHDLLQLLARSPGDHAAWLAGWVALLDTLQGDDLQVDHVPHNVLVQGDGTMCFIDSEWSWPGQVDRRWVLGRGVVWAAASLARTTYPSAWPGAGTVGDVAALLASAAGLDAGWLEETLERESRYQAVVAPRTGRSDGAERERHRVELETMLGQRLTSMPLGDRVVHELQTQVRLRAEAVHAHMLMEVDRDTVRGERDAAQDRVARLERELAGAHAEAERLRSRRVVRLADGAHETVRRVRGLRRGD